MKTEQRFTEVAILDICTPDYFTGYHMPVIQVNVWHNMTNQELKEQIENFINSDFDYLVNEDTESSYTEKEIELFEQFANNLLNETSNIIDVPEIECDCVDECECEQFYLFLGLCKPVIRQGIKFLNE
jgi:hypothetical protein